MGLQPMRAQRIRYRYCLALLGIVTSSTNRELNFWCGSTQSFPPGGKSPVRTLGDRGYPGGLYCPGCVLGGAVPSFVSLEADTFPQGEGSAPPEAARQIPVYRGNDTERVWATSMTSALCTNWLKAHAFKFQFVHLYTENKRAGKPMVFRLVLLMMFQTI